jgi:uncharacterized protein (TIGR03083 family)
MLASVIETTDQATAVRTLRDVGRRTVELVATIDNADRAVPGLEWTVGDTATHVLIELRAFTEALDGHVVGITQFVPELEGYTARMAAMTSGTLKAEPRRAPRELSELMRVQLDAFVKAIDEQPADRTLDTPWYGAGESIPLRAAISLQIGELMIHGLDIARGLGRPWPISREEALQVLFPSTFEMMPRVVHKALTRDANGVYRVRFRGGPAIGVRFTNGVLDVAPWDQWNARPDVTLSADPVAFLLLGYGRKTQWPLIAQGRLFAYGRKPWLALQLRALFANP